MLKKIAILLSASLFMTLMAFISSPDARKGVHVRAVTPAPVVFPAQFQATPDRVTYTMKVTTKSGSGESARDKRILL